MIDPHAGQPVLIQGPPLGSVQAVAILLHGRNAGPRNILDLTSRLDLASQLERPDFTYVAPAAANRTWYPLSFLSEIDKNEPALSSALRRVDEVVAQVVDAGVPRSRIVLIGFSQGACLAAEYACRHPARYGGVIVLSGGLIGPPGTVWSGEGSMDETPVFLGCSDSDPHVPQWRVDESAQVFTRMGADVTERIYPGMGHLVADDELEFARAVMDRVGHAL